MLSPGTKALKSITLVPGDKAEPVQTPPVVPATATTFKSMLLPSSEQTKMSGFKVGSTSATISISTVALDTQFKVEVA